MTVVLICNHFPPVVDGVGDYTRHLAQELALAGLEVHIICREQPHLDIPAGISVHPLVKKWNREGVHLIVEHIRGIQPDWVGLQYVPYGFNRFGTPLLLPHLLKKISQAGVAIWITFHEVHIRLQGLRGWVFGSIQRRIARNLCGYARVCVTSIEFYRDLLDPFHPEIKVIPVGSNVSIRLLSLAKRTEMRQRHFPDQSFLVSTFGARNHAALIESIAQLNADGAGIGLIICGQVVPSGELRELSWVHYTGYLPAEAIGGWLQCSDLFVLPDFVSARGEGGACLKSGALAAGFAAALPVIGIRGDMTDKMLEHAKNIWLAPDGSPAEWTRAIRTVWQNPEIRERLQKNARRFHEEYLAWEKIAGQYLDFLGTPQHDRPIS